MLGTITASRRGVSKLVTPPPARRSRLSSAPMRSRSSWDAESIIRAGISSHPISSRKSGMLLNLLVSQTGAPVECDSRHIETVQNPIDSAAFEHQVLRLRGSFAARNFHSAQDDRA